MLAMIVKIFYAVMLCSIGYLIIRYRRNVKSWTGNFYWAERYIGSGGTYFVIMLIGLFLIFLGALRPFGGMDLLIGDRQNLLQNNFGK